MINSRSYETLKLNFYRTDPYTTCTRSWASLWLALVPPTPPCKQQPHSCSPPCTSWAEPCPCDGTDRTERKSWVLPAHRCHPSQTARCTPVTLQKKHLAHSSLRYNKFGYSGAPLSPQNSFDIQTLEANTWESGAESLQQQPRSLKRKKSKIKYFIYSLRKATELIAGITGQ